VDVVVALGLGAFTRIKGYRMPMRIVELAYDARYHKSRGIGTEIMGMCWRRTKNNIPRIKDQG